MDEVFVLMEDADQTTFSTKSPTGQAVTSEDQAKEWVARDKFGRGYVRVTVLEKVEG